MDSKVDVLVLGIGNVLWADEGFGVRAVEEMARRYRFPDNVRLLDGGTQGIYLVHQVRSADILVVFDAVDYGLTPGTMKRVEGAEVPRFMGAKKMSLHQTGFQEVLAAAALTEQLPASLLLIGVQPVELDDYGGSLTPEIRASIGEAVELAAARLRDWGFALEPRTGANTGSLNDASLNLDAYETGRPSEQAACRVGDGRVLWGS
jgi:hydrogenase maturation protease